MIRRILVPLDGSELAEDVLLPVRDLATGLHAKVYLVRAFQARVVDYLAFRPDALSSAEAWERAADLERKDVEGYLSKVCGWLGSEGLDVSWEAVEGNAVEKIVERAHSNDVDIVAMATHGRSNVGRAVSGSVAEEVLREVGIPVLLVKPQEREFSRTDGRTDEDIDREAAGAFEWIGTESWGPIDLP